MQLLQKRAIANQLLLLLKPLNITNYDHFFSHKFSYANLKQGKNLWTETNFLTRWDVTKMNSS